MALDLLQEKGITNSFRFEISQGQPLVKGNLVSNDSLYLGFLGPIEDNIA